MYSPRPQRGMALVITLIMLAVITFLAVTFLAVSRRDRATVTTMTDQTTAKLAADAGLERAKAELLVPILATTNFANYGLMVSTNYFSTNFISGVANPTNVNYNSAIAQGDEEFRLNIANLLYSPRAPVFVRTNTAVNSRLDFRYYLDLNRNGRYDTNGLIAEIDIEGDIVRTNGVPMFKHYTGDPEWIGVLEKPDQPHSPSNRFVARVAYIAVPSGKTLDVNYIHNQALTRSLDPANDGFFRNQGVGTWEINLAAFLADLNTNVWLGGLPTVTPTFYAYNQPAFANVGNAFADALSLLPYRYAGNYGNLQRANQVLGNNGGPVPNDGIDQYTDGPLYTTNASALDNDQVNNSWVGSDNRNAFFTTQDFYDAAKLPGTFATRMRAAGNSVSTYDRYTFYRMLDQLGTDGGPEASGGPDVGKINVNYVNVDARGMVSHNIVTNFTPWRAEQFFTNTADRLVRLYSADWSRTDRTNFVRNFNFQNSFALTNIPVWVSNRFVYSPAVHRLLQLTANIYEVQTNRLFVGDNANSRPHLPTVFRPKFRKEGDSNIIISGFVEVDTRADHTAVRAKRPYDLNRASDRSALLSLPENVLEDVNIYGVPLIIGAKKGLPNFNKFAVETISQLTRKLEVRRLDTNSPPNRTNTMYLISISNVVAAVEVWNSYVTNYPRGVQMFVENDMSISLVVSNENELLPTIRSRNVVASSFTNFGPNLWTARTSNAKRHDEAVTASFRIPFYTNIFFLPSSVYRPGTRTFQPASDADFDGPEYYQPRFYLSVTNRLRYFMTDPDTLRIVDYVQLNDLNSQLNLSDEIMDDNDAVGAKGLWITNRSGGNSLLNPPEGILNQLEISLGNTAISDSLWRSEGGVGNRQDEQRKFRNFVLGEGNAGGDALVAQAPFNAAKKISQMTIWQANDPLVHYTAADLQNPAAGNGVQELSLATDASFRQMTEKLRRFNDRYAPWGRDGDAVSTSPGYKDPMVRSSDDWDFPTNKFPNVGWLGRVHRGTPWQTVYMKASDVLASKADFNNWRLWSGHTRFFELTNMAPRADRLLFDVFTAAVNENATRGQLSVNQTGEAAWSAVLSGVVVLTTNTPEGDVAKDKTPRFGWTTIQPAGANTNSATWKMISGINRQREKEIIVGQPPSATNDLFPGKAFRYTGDILSVPELTDQSPFINRSTDMQRKWGLNDAAYERIPQQIMGLLRADDEPRFTIYAFGQSLKPAPRSIITSGAQFGLCTNYQVTAEVATRTVVRVKGAPKPGDVVGATPEVLIESYNLLGPD